MIASTIRRRGFVLAHVRDGADLIDIGLGVGLQAATQDLIECFRLGALEHPQDLAAVVVL
ncbi:MAG TPA: hypothetical protein VFI76_03180 [Terrimicrobiaceae bacterium]|nr:hypothetical protein [Terrimicrobiaceae bacterium]